MKNVIIGLLLVLGQGSLQAAKMMTPGAIASFSTPAGMQFQYEPIADQSFLVKAQQAQIILSVLPAVEPGFGMQQVLHLFQVPQYIPQIKLANFAGYPAAMVNAQLQTSNWWLVIRTPELGLLVRVEDVEDAMAHQSAVEQLVRSVRFAGASQPPLVSGHYTTSSSFSGGNLTNDTSVYSESSVTLHADGGLGSSAHTGVTGSGVSGYSQGDGPGGWWQVRGNRILAYVPPADFYNYRFEAFSNGLELYNEANEKLLWVRN